jgi:predicted RNA-binding protein with PIN domain
VKEGVEGAEFHFLLLVNGTYGMVMVMTTNDAERERELDRARQMIVAAVSNMVFYGEDQAAIEAVFDAAVVEANAERENREARARLIARISARTAGAGTGYSEAA